VQLVGVPGQVCAEIAEHLLLGEENLCDSWCKFIAEIYSQPVEHELGLLNLYNISEGTGFNDCDLVTIRYRALTLLEGRGSHEQWIALYCAANWQR
jgi:hypothetical protein